jgi:hypothetical protein
VKSRVLISLYLFRAFFKDLEKATYFLKENLIVFSKGKDLHRYVDLLGSTNSLNRLLEREKRVDHYAY